MKSSVTNLVVAALLVAIGVGIDHRLLSPALDLGSAEARALLVRWGRLHAVRTLLSLCAAGAYAWLIVRA
jgi:hypothetical protein